MKIPKELGEVRTLKELLNRALTEYHLASTLKSVRLDAYYDTKYHSGKCVMINQSLDSLESVVVTVTHLLELTYNGEVCSRCSFKYKLSGSSGEPEMTLLSAIVSMQEVRGNLYRRNETVCTPADVRAAYLELNAQRESVMDMNDVRERMGDSEGVAQANAELQAAEDAVKSYYRSEEIRRTAVKECADAIAEMQSATSPEVHLAFTEAGGNVIMDSYRDSLRELWSSMPHYVIVDFSANDVFSNGLRKRNSLMRFIEAAWRKESDRLSCVPIAAYEAWMKVQECNPYTTVTLPEKAADDVMEVMNSLYSEFRGTLRELHSVATSV